MTKNLERRITDAHPEVRTNADGTIGVSGYAAVFDSPFHGEVVKRSAFTRTLDQRDNVRLLVNHDGVPLASVKAGTMTLRTDDRGLKIDAPSLDSANPRVQELVSALSRGDIDQMSFAFTASDDPVVSGVRELREVKLFDVSVVTYPWYEDTAVSLTGHRGFDKALVSVRSCTPEQRTAMLHAALRVAPPGKTSYGDVSCQVCDAITEMLAGLGSVSPWIWIDDLGADWAVYSIFDEDDWDMFQIPYKLAKDGTITLGTPFEVDCVSEYRPVTVDDGTPMRTYTIAEARTLLASRTAA